MRERMIKSTWILFVYAMLDDLPQYGTDEKMNGAAVPLQQERVKGLREGF